MGYYYYHGPAAYDAKVGDAVNSLPADATDQQIQDAADSRGVDYQRVKDSYAEKYAPKQDYTYLDTFQSNVTPAYKKPSGQTVFRAKTEAEQRADAARAIVSYSDVYGEKKNYPVSQSTATAILKGESGGIKGIERDLLVRQRAGETFARQAIGGTTAQTAERAGFKITGQSTGGAVMLERDNKVSYINPTFRQTIAIAPKSAKVDAGFIRPTIKQTFIVYPEERAERTEYRPGELIQESDKLRAFELRIAKQREWEYNFYNSENLRRVYDVAGLVRGPVGIFGSILTGNTRTITGETAHKVTYELAASPFLMYAGYRGVGWRLAATGEALAYSETRGKVLPVIGRNFIDVVPELKNVFSEPSTYVLATFTAVIAPTPLPKFLSKFQYSVTTRPFKNPIAEQTKIATRGKIFTRSPGKTEAEYLRAIVPEKTTGANAPVVTIGRGGNLLYRGKTYPFNSVQVGRSTYYFANTGTNRIIQIKTAQGKLLTRIIGRNDKVIRNTITDYKPENPKINTQNTALIRAKRSDQVDAGPKEGDNVFLMQRNTIRRARYTARGSEEQFIKGRDVIKAVDAKAETTLRQRDVSGLQRTTKITKTERTETFRYSNIEYALQPKQLSGSKIVETPFKGGPADKITTVTQQPGLTTNRANYFKSETRFFYSQSRVKPLKAAYLYLKGAAGSLRGKKASVLIQQPSIKAGYAKVETAAPRPMKGYLDTEPPLSSSAIYYGLNKLPQNKPIVIPMARTVTKPGQAAISSPKIKTEPVTSTRVNVQPFSGLKPKSEIKTEITPKTEIRAFTDLKAETRANTRAETRTQTVTVPVITTTTLTKTTTTTAPPSPVNVIKTPQNPVIDAPFTTVKARSTFKGPSMGFKALVKRRGKFSPIGTFSSPKEAFIKGRERVRTTAAASFKVISTAGQTITEKLPSPDITTSKRSPGVFVQRRGFRISTPGEKREITYKGINQRRGRGLFNIFKK